MRSRSGGHYGWLQRDNPWYWNLLDQQPPQIGDERGLHIQLPVARLQPHEVEHVRVAGDLLNQVGVGGGQVVGEFDGATPWRRCSWLASMVSNPPAESRTAYHSRTAWSSSRSSSTMMWLQGNCAALLRPRLGEGPHVVQIPAAEPASVGETGAEVGGEPLDHPGAPPLCRLPLQDEVPDAPIHADQLAFAARAARTRLPATSALTASSNAT